MMGLSVLTRTPLFRAMSVSDIEEIFSGLNIIEGYYKKDDILAQQDELCNRLILLISGSVKGEMSSPSGKTIKVEDIFAPSPLAILFLFGKVNRFPVQITARENVATVIIPKQSMLNMLGRNETLLKNYLDISADFASRLSDKLHFMSFRTIRQKIAMYILKLSKMQESDIIILDKTKSALAEYFGVSRQSLERELSNMQQENLIVTDKKEISIPNKENLIRMIRF